MMFLADSSESEEVIARELECEVNQLITPLTRRSNHGGVFAIDNGAFSHFDSKSFLTLLEREKENKARCLFVAAPDVVGDARRTLECFEHWYPVLQSWPIALVAQDGQGQLPIPWALIKAVFIGGSTHFKMSSEAAAIIKAAKIFEKWVHVGRINTQARWEYFEDLGADSCDGTGISRYSHMRAAIHQPNIFSES